jgi:hypothetical protein
MHEYGMNSLGKGLQKDHMESMENLKFVYIKPSRLTLNTYTTCDMGLATSHENLPLQLPEDLQLAIQDKHTLRSISNQTRQTEIHDLILQRCTLSPTKKENKISRKRTATTDADGFSLCQSPRSRKKNKNTIVCGADNWAQARYILDRAASPIIVATRHHSQGIVFDR